MDTLRAALAGEERLGKFRPKRLHLEPDGVLIFEAEADTILQKKIALRVAVAKPQITGIVDRLRVYPADRMGDAEIRSHLRRIFSTDATLQGISVFERHGEQLAVLGDSGNDKGSHYCYRPSCDHSELSKLPGH